jgi:hypothetical protein
MFTRALLTTCALIALAAYTTYHFTLRSHPNDVAAYHKLVQESTELRTRHALAEQPARQDRQGVQKDIWSQNETRHYQIQSEHSTLTLTQKKDKIEAIENLKRLHCSFGSDTLTADDGIYIFPSHQFTAQNNCRIVHNDNYIDGTAIYSDLSQEIITYDNPQGYFAPFNFTACSLIWYKKEGKLLLEGNVRLNGTLQDKPSYAIADTVTYHPIDKTILLSSQHKVLFWQDGLSLSATSVRIREDQTVEGHGNVHFAFDLEEQNSINELFKQYL